MKENIKIRFAQPTDINQIIKLCKAHAVYEQCDYHEGNKSSLLSKALFSEVPKLYCLVVEKDEKLVGYATYMKQYATWNAEDYIYMDCLYLEETIRGNGIGEVLINNIKTEAKKLGCNLIQWQTPNFNVRAIKFYKRIGAESKSKERFFLNAY